MTQFNLDTMKLWPTFGWPLSSGSPKASGNFNPDALVFTIQIPNDNFTFKCPTGNGYSSDYDATVDWGDGTTSTVTDQYGSSLNTPNDHTYAKAGTYQVSIEGIFKEFSTYYGLSEGFKSAKCIISLDNLGKTGLDNLWYGFYSCQNMVSFNVGNTDARPSSIRKCFSYCNSLTDLDLTGLDWSSCYEASSVFERMSSVETIELGSIQNAPLQSIYSMFKYCDNLKSIDLSRLQTQNVNSTSYMFNRCPKLEAITLGNGWDTSKVGSMDSMFDGCSSLVSLDVSNWNTSSVYSMYSMFNSCRLLATLDVSNWDVSSVTNMGRMFYTCSSLVSLDVSNWDVSSVTNLREMFRSATRLPALDVSNWDTSNVTDMNAMFNFNMRLQALDVSNWNTSNVTNMESIFFYCMNVQALDVSNWDTSNVTIMKRMFYSLYNASITGVENFDITSLSSSSVLDGFLYAVNLSTSTYDALLVNWEAQNPISGVSTNFGNSKYTSGSSAETARNSLINNYGWSISDNGST